MPQLKVVKSRSPSALDRLVDDYLVHCRAAGLSPKTVKFSYGYPLSYVFLPWCAERGITDIAQMTNRVLDRLAAELNEKGGARGPLSKSSIWTYLKAINRFLAWAKEEGEGTGAKAPVPRLTQKVIEVLSRDEIKRMEDAAQSSRDELIVRILGDTGLRVGELVALRTSDLRQESRQYTLRVRGKGGRERLVPITSELHRRLTRYIASKRPTDSASERVFLSLRKVGDDYVPLTESGVQQLIHDLAEKAGIKRRVHPHLFRHSAATFLLQQGMNPLLVAQVLGHSSLAMIQKVYAHLSVSDASAAMMKALRPDA